MTDAGETDDRPLVGSRFRRLNARTFRDTLADVVEQIEESKQPIIITRRGKDRVAVVTIDDLRELEILKESAARRSIPPPQLAKEWALFLDVDGTLIEAASRPELVTVPKHLPVLLQRLADERNGAVALLSGRRIADLDRLFPTWRGAVAGLHGGERRRADGTLVHVSEVIDRATVEAFNQIRPSLIGVAAHHAGIWFED